MLVVVGLLFHVSEETLGISRRGERTEPGHCGPAAGGDAAAQLRGGELFLGSS